MFDSREGSLRQVWADRDCNLQWNTVSRFSLLLYCAKWAALHKTWSQPKKVSKKDKKTYQHTWGHFTLASFAGTRSAFSSSFLKMKIMRVLLLPSVIFLKPMLVLKTNHFIKNINSECSFVAPMIFSASSPRLNPETVGTAGVTLTLNIMTHLVDPWLPWLSVRPWFAFRLCRVSFLFWHVHIL